MIATLFPQASLEDGCELLARAVSELAAATAALQAEIAMWHPPAQEQQ